MRMLSPGSRVDSNFSDLDSHGLVHINASEYFPKKDCVTDDPELSFPFPVISGESVEYLGRTAEDGLIALSNYRIFIQYPQSYVNGESAFLPEGFRKVRSVFGWHNRLLPPRVRLVAGLGRGQASGDLASGVETTTDKNRGFLSESETVHATLMPCSAKGLLALISTATSPTAKLCPSLARSEDRDVLRPRCKTENRILANLPVRMIEQADIQNYTNSIIFTCKNGTTVRCSFLSADRTFEWQKRILSAINAPKKLEDLFAFTFYAWKSEERSGSRKNPERRCFNSLSAAGFAFDLQCEAKRMKFDLDKTWRISEINVKYEISPTYPKFHIVPNCVSDTDLMRSAEFRGSRRFPSIVWRHKKNGSVLARSSQPELGILLWRNPQDENLLQAISASCAIDRSFEAPISNGHIPNGDAQSLTMPKLLILDARSYTAAMANRAKGGGSECTEYYPNCEIQYMNMANIHSVRKSFYQLRQLCTSPADRVDFMSTLDKSLWLHHVSAIIRTTVHVVNGLDVDAKPVLVHCSDGWDRTTQIVALSMMMLDPHYRTIRGFQTLIEWQWLEFGHKFADRCGHGASTDETERCPIFLQWLDCVFQLVNQFSVEFEFNEAYLIHVAHHAYSCLFGTFLGNTAREREKNTVNDRTYSLWNYLEQEADENFSNLLYAKRDVVLRPDFDVRNLSLWRNLYITERNPLSANVHPPEVICVGNDPKIGNPNLPRTRSVENISKITLATQPMETNLHRTSSENNILSNSPAVENGLSIEIGLPIENGVSDEHSEAGTPETIIENPALTDVAGNPQILVVSSGKNPQVSFHKSASVNGINGLDSNHIEEESDDNDDSPNTSRSAPRLVNGTNGLDTSRTSSNGAMERSTDTITGEENIHTLLLERYPSNQDIRTEDEESVDEEKANGDVTSESDGETRMFLRSGSPMKSSPARMICSMRDDDLWHESLGKPSVDTNNKPISESLMRSAIFSDANSLKEGMSVPRRVDSKISMPMSVTPTPLKMVEINHPGSPVSSPTRPRRTSRHLPSASSSESVHSELNDSFHEHNLAVVRRQLGPDGLAILHDSTQIRLRQIRDGYQKQVDTLRRELSSVKSSLRSRNGFVNGSSHNRRESCSEDALNAVDIPGMGTDTVDYGTSYGSDVSWDNIDDGEAQTTPWVPDSSVTNCTNCASRFWLGKRKHHCRKCHKIFCSSCSDYQIPIPQDRLYTPVRVCRSCYSELYKQTNGMKALVNRRLNSQQPTHA